MKGKQPSQLLKKFTAGLDAKVRRYGKEGYYNMRCR